MARDYASSCCVQCSDDARCACTSAGAVRVHLSPTTVGCIGTQRRRVRLARCGARAVTVARLKLIA